MTKRGKKKGVSPIIATVLLIGIVVAMGTIIFLWVRGFVKEEGTKFGKNIKLVCEDVQFDASYSVGNLGIVNVGNIPIFRVKIKVYGSAGYETKDITDMSSEWPPIGLKQGEVFSGNIDISGAKKIVVIPVLIGSSGSGEKVFTCEEKYGYEISL
jgi:flagellin-like protein